MPGCGCGSPVIIIIIVIFIIIILSAGGNSLFSSGSDSSITKSTFDREPLPSGSVNETDYYTDNLGWIGNRTVFLAGLKNFYQKTGVQPYVYITDTVNGSHSPTEQALDDYSRALYDELFTDEAHLLLVFFEYNGGYMTRYVAGTQAKTVIDIEAGDILLDYLDRYYYYDNLTDEEYFSKSFSDAADRIMTVTRSPLIPVFTVLAILAVIFVLFLWWKNAKKQKALEAKRTADILNTPLEKFGDSEAEDLAKKYDDDSKE